MKFGTFFPVWETELGSKNSLVLKRSMKLEVERPAGVSSAARPPVIEPMDVCRKGFELSRDELRPAEKQVQSLKLEQTAEETLHRFPEISKNQSRNN